MNGLGWSLGGWVPKVAPRSMDFEFYMVATAFVVAFLVFGVGFLVRWRTGGGAVSTPPPLPAGVEPVTWQCPAEVTTPYAPPQSEGRQPLARRLGLSLNRVSCRIYRPMDLVLMAFLVGIYMVPLLLDLVGTTGNAPVEIGMEAVIGTIVTQTFMVALVLGMVVWRLSPATWLGLGWPQWRWVFLLAPVGVLSTWAFMAGLDVWGYNLWLQEAMGIGEGEGQQEVVSAFSSVKDPVLLGLLSFTAVIVAPVSEEVLFRGYLYPVSKRFIGRAPAVLFSALVFAAIHHNALALVPLCFLALLLALSYELTGSIWAPIGIHLLFNGVTVGFQLASNWGWIALPES